MAVVERKRKKFTTYYAVNEWRGEQIAEKIGPNKRAAEIRDRAMKKEIKAGTYVPPKETLRHAEVFMPFAKAWSEPRTNAYAPDERRLLRLYAFSRPWIANMRLDEWKPADTDQLVKELQAEKKPNGKRRLSDKTIANLMGVLSLVFDAAVRLGKCLMNPIQLAPRTLKRRPAEEKEIYAGSEVRVLTRHHAIPWPVRVLNALTFFTGMREGEACGRRWRDLLDGEPLHAISVHDQYDGKPLKTERSRMVPIHPELHEILEAWAEEGFELYTGRKPSPDDFIVPNVSRRAKRANHTRSSYYKLFVRYAEAAGVRPRSLHSTRHTFITGCERGGADEKDLEKVTHNAAGNIIDRYTHRDWSPLCAAVMCLKIDAHPELHPGRRTPGNSGGSGSSILPSNRSESALIVQTSGVQFPAPPLLPQPKKPGPVKSRQDSRQGFELTPGDLREANRKRKRALLGFAEADPSGAKPGLAFTRALDEALKGDGADPGVMAAELAKAGDALKHLLPEEARSYVATGKRGAK